jgi:radical SAM-linked protein
LDQARFFGHLELVNIFLRALRRAEIPIKFSEGFHPMPRVSFDDPLPIGMEGTHEFMYLTIPDHIQPWKIKKGLNAFLPRGLHVNDCRLVPARSSGDTCRFVTYQITIKDGFFDEKLLNCFKASREVILTRKDRKGRWKTIDLKDVISEIVILTPRSLQMILKSKPGKTMRPFDVIRKIFNLPDENLKRARIVKRVSADTG